jgi:hypothetical protein
MREFTKMISLIVFGAILIGIMGGIILNIAFEYPKCQSLKQEQIK